LLKLLTFFLFINLYHSNSFCNALDSIVLSKNEGQNFSYIFNVGWKFKSLEKSYTKTFPDTDDSWIELSPKLYYSDSIFTSFPNEGWFKFNFIADSSITNIPLEIHIIHYGASEIYLDSVLIGKFGKINGEKTINYYPQSLSNVFSISRPGEHSFIVKYANFKAARNWIYFSEPFVGFKMSINEISRQINNNEDEMSLTFMLLLGGIFLTISFFHLFLYIFYPIEKSNLFFSLLMFCSGIQYIFSFIKIYSHDPFFILLFNYLMPSLFCLTPLILYAFTIELFKVKKGWIYKLLISAFLIITVLQLSRYTNIPYLKISSLVISSCLSLIYTVNAIIKNKKGVRIIGVGIIITVILILVLFASILVPEINESFSQYPNTLEIIFFLTILTIPISMSLHQAQQFSIVNNDLASQLTQVKTLSEKTLQQELEKQKLLENRKEELEKEVVIRTIEILNQKNLLEKEKEKTDELLLNILPAEVAEELKTKGSAEAKQFDTVTVMFTDFKGFSQISEHLSAAELVAEIDTCFKAFDAITSKYNIEKIKTIGDSYMCAGGLPVKNKTNAYDVIGAALEIQRFMEEYNQKKTFEKKESFEIRIGVHTGPVVAGIVGIKKFAYDIWGDTVNIASRMESSGEVGKVNISGTTYEFVKDRFLCTYRGKVEAKNKGMIDMYFVESLIEKQNN